MECYQEMPLHGLAVAGWGTIPVNELPSPAQSLSLVVY